ncbi:MAG: hypothetical protein IJ419_16925 [Agathobacter sp.]|nr:hypothetical protein [Agathobacter sp.]
MKQMTFKEYRRVDLMMLTILVIVFEAIATYASGKWFWVQAINISVTLLLVCISMMRWSGFAAIHAVVGGFVYCFAAGATKEQYVIYCIGNLFSLSALLLIKIFGKEKIRNSILKLASFAIVAYLGMAVGRCLMSLFFGGDIRAFIVYVTTDIISLLFAVIVLIFLRKSDGMIEDQKSYLFRLERERQEEGAYEENDVIL